jgi:hypothetical protein
MNPQATMSSGNPSERPDNTEPTSQTTRNSSMSNAPEEPAADAPDTARPMSPSEARREYGEYTTAVLTEASRTDGGTPRYHRNPGPCILTNAGRSKGVGLPFVLSRYSCIPHIDPTTISSSYREAKEASGYAPGLHQSQGSTAPGHGVLGR